MAYSSILGAERAPAQPSGRSSDLLGPSDNSDSGSDAVGTQEANGDSDGVGTGERAGAYGADAIEGADIAPDRVVRMNEDGVELSDDASLADAGGQEFTDLDVDADDESAER